MTSLFMQNIWLVKGAQICLVIFFKNKRTHLQYLRLAVAFGWYAYAANKFTLGANSF